VTARCFRDEGPSKIRKIVTLSISASLAMFVADRSAVADNDRGAELAATCAPCHRLDGRDKGIPSIIGLDEETFIRAMQAFKSGERSSQIMRVMSRSLSNEEIATLAHYLSTLRMETKRP
jgi:cytochrome subunit of sulfide dehydrogenase